MGRRLLQFEVLERIGAGGVGEVYRARDTKLDRVVALKALPSAYAVDAERRERFRREAIAASALNHPNICTVHDLAEAEGHHLIVMELVEGETLHERLKRGPMAVAEALAVATQILEELSEAHRAGILHRDVKCNNVALTKRGRAKVLDFGLAKLLEAGGEGEAATLERLTEEGASPGTPGYVSPEQLLGKPLDGRSDLFGFGVVLYRMVTGRLPFEGKSAMALATAVLKEEPRDLGPVAAPERLKGIVRKLLDKDREKRHGSAEEALKELKVLAEELSPRKGGLSKGAKVALAAAAILVVAFAGWSWHRWSRERWALTRIPEIEKLVGVEELWMAATLLREARAAAPENPVLEALWVKATEEETLDTDPTGATLTIRPMLVGAAPVETVGQTPLKKVRLPADIGIWRIHKPGFAPLEIFGFPGDDGLLKLLPEASVRPGMVPVIASRVALPRIFGEAPAVDLPAFLIDRHEVTNAEYARFVEAGGYGRRDLWKEPFVTNGSVLSWEDAVARFVDATGRPGPATWEVGSFPRGQDDRPVSGVSWYEAAAYASFVGKALPTAYHWTFASQSDHASLIVSGSNFGGVGTLPVGAPGALSGFGTTDMAGNVKVWCRNERRPGARVILGGGFDEPSYRFLKPGDESPWDGRTSGSVASRS